MIKPVVLFLQPAVFDEYMGNPACIIAFVFTLNHPHLGAMKVRTSEVISLHEDGSFETVNTRYVPFCTYT